MAAEGVEEHSKVRKVTVVKVLWDRVTHSEVFGFCFWFDGKTYEGCYEQRAEGV